VKKGGKVSPEHDCFCYMCVLTPGWREALPAQAEGAR
jgi:hypothetical protein